MRLGLKNRSLAVAFVAAVATFGAIGASAQIAPIGARATSITIQGVPNAGSVTGNLFRGAQPNYSAYAGLQKLGMDIVVDLRYESSEISSEKKAVEAAGMQFVNLPWSGTGLPSREQLLTFFTLLRDNPDKKIFLHCQYGADRTGVMIALYRIAVDHWTPEQAIAEMKDFHYHSFMLPHLAKYVRAFPATLAGDPSLAGSVPGPRPSPPVAKTAAAQDPLNQ
jgi:protein tyrosine phosphatase (PTP) superfamily phosphohydrolase (DUF442 family)